MIRIVLRMRDSISIKVSVLIALLWGCTRFYRLEVNCN